MTFLGLKNDIFGDFLRFLTSFKISFSSLQHPTLYVIKVVYCTILATIGTISLVFMLCGFIEKEGVYYTCLNNYTKEKYNRIWDHANAVLDDMKLSEFTNGTL